MSSKGKSRGDSCGKEGQQDSVQVVSNANRKRRRHNDDKGHSERPSKKRRKGSEPKHTFYHGGDITDPLNLRSSTLEGSNSAENGKKSDEKKDTVQNSKFPENFHDPLNLQADIKRERKKRKKLRKESKKEDEAETGEERKEQKWKRRKRKSRDSRVEKKISFRPKDVRFVYGNYNRYYGYRNPEQAEDGRLSCLPKQLFTGKQCLDIGCNIGHVTLAIARRHSPKHILGIDIDSSLIEHAKKNVGRVLSQISKSQSLATGRFPLSCSLTLGPIVPQVAATSTMTMKNASFQQENYVVESLAAACEQKAEYDTILCLSITKWIHYNWGDNGVKRLFHRIYHHLKPGGVLVLEPQLWPSYHKKRKLTPAIFHNYGQIRLRPEKFSEYLVQDVGFASVDQLPMPKHDRAGFQRPIYLLTKSEMADLKCNLCRSSEKKAMSVKEEERREGKGVSRLTSTTSTGTAESSCWETGSEAFETSADESETMDSDAFMAQS